VASTAKLHKEGRFKDNPHASGFGRIAPDGAVTAIAAKHIIMERSQYDPVCGMPFQKSSLDPDIKPMTVAPDGSIVFPHESRVLRLTPAGRVEGIPNRPESCAAPAPAAKSPFSEPEAAVQDPRGNVWVSDGCTLWRMAADGTVTPVLGPAQMCLAGEPENYIRGEFLRGHRTRRARPERWHALERAPKANYYSMIHRLKRTAHRVECSRREAGPVGPRVDGTSGLAVDAKGGITLRGVADPGNGYQVTRLDEAKGTPVLVAGPLPSNVNHGMVPPARPTSAGSSMCISPDGTLYMNDTNNVIRKPTRPRR
jgi:hypothetical protein